MCFFSLSVVLPLLCKNFSFLRSCLFFSFSFSRFLYLNAKLGNYSVLFYSRNVKFQFSFYGKIASFSKGSLTEMWTIIMFQCMDWSKWRIKSEKLAIWERFKYGNILYSEKQHQKCSSRKKAANNSMFVPIAFLGSENIVCLMSTFQVLPLTIWINANRLL